MSSAGGPFVVLFEGRSGSTWLVEALDSHPAIHAELEVFASMRKREMDAETQLQWAREHLAPPYPDPIHATGFKTKRRDVLDPEGFERLLRDLEARIVLLTRRNRIKKVVSVFNAMRLHDATGDWNLYQEDERKPGPLSLDVERFRKWLRVNEDRKERLEEYAEGIGAPLYRLHYEDLLVDRSEALASVCRFLEVQPMDLQGRARKNTSDDLRQAVGNFDELRDAFVGTPYEPMFDEVLVPGGPGAD